MTSQSFAPRIAVERGSVSPGGLVRARVENHGSDAISFGLAYKVQQFGEGRWLPAPGGPGDIWPQIALLLGSGESGGCMPYRVPDGAPPGRYRFVKQIDSTIGDGRGRTLRIGFRVLG